MTAHPLLSYVLRTPCIVAYPHFTPLKAQDTSLFSCTCRPVYLAFEVMARVVDDDDQYITYCDVAKGKKWTGNQQSSLRVLEWQDGKLRTLHFKLRTRCLRAVKGVYS
jgi:hypothetical protein